MQRALMDYGKARQIVFIHGPTPEKKTEAIGEIARFFDSIANAGADCYNAKVFQKEETMTEYLSRFEPIIGDGSELAAASDTAAGA